MNIITSLEELEAAGMGDHEVAIQLREEASARGSMTNGALDGPVPYYPGRGPKTGMTEEDIKVSTDAARVLQLRHGLSHKEAQNWLDTGNSAVGYDFAQVEPLSEEVPEEVAMMELTDEELEDFLAAEDTRAWLDENVWEEA